MYRRSAAASVPASEGHLNEEASSLRGNRLFAAPASRSRRVPQDPKPARRSTTNSRVGERRTPSPPLPGTSLTAEAPVGGRVVAQRADEIHPPESRPEDIYEGILGVCRLPQEESREAGLA